MQSAGVRKLIAAGRFVQGNYLPACIAHGPDGDAARTINEPGSEWVWTFWASSHAQAMSIYYEFVGYEKYIARCDDDLVPYSQAMHDRQAACLRSP